MIKQIVIAGLLVFVSCGVVSAERHIIVVRDVTVSYGKLEEGDKLVMEKVIPKLGENDIIEFVDLGNFKDGVAGSFTMPKVEPEVPNEVLTPFERRKRIRETRQIEREVEQTRKTIIDWLEQQGTRQVGGYTDVHTIIGFVNTTLQASPKDEKILIMYSDLVYTSKGNPKTNRPPEWRSDWSGVNVFFLYVPFTDYKEWQELTKAWSEFFSGSQSFTMCNNISSANTVIINKNAKE